MVNIAYHVDLNSVEKNSSSEVIRWNSEYYHVYAQCTSTISQVFMRFYVSAAISSESGCRIASSLKTVIYF